MRRAAKRDDNEAMVVRALGNAGWTVVRVSDAGAPDLLCARMGELRLLEVKGPKGTLTGAQEVAFERLNKAGVTVLVVRSPRDALEALGAPQSFDGKEVRVARFVAENGAFLCEQCWCPENGLHAKDCPTRLVLKRPPKEETAHRSAKKARDLLPKKHQDRLSEANAVDLRDNMRLEHLGGGYSRAVAIDPTKRHGEAPDWMAEAVREHHEELRKAKPTAADERRCRDCADWAGVCPHDGKQCEPVRKSRGVEGELQPLKACQEPGCLRRARPDHRHCSAHMARL